MKEYMSKEVKIGLAGIISLLILFFGINYLKGISMLKPESYYYIDFTNVNGLTQSSPVFTNGFKVGIVRDIKYNHNNPGHIIVGVEMEPDIKIPTGSQAEVVMEMLGTVKMNLNFDYNSQTYYEEGDTLYGIANEGLMGAAEKNIVPQIEKMLPKLDSILGSLNKILNSPALNNTLKNTEELTASLNATGKQLNNLMSNDIPKLTNNVTTISENLKDISANLKDVDYAATIKKADSTIHNVLLLTDKLNRKDNTLGLLLNDSSLYNNLNATSANAASLLFDLKAHPKRYVHFSLFGKKDK